MNKSELYCSQLKPTHEMIPSSPIMDNQQQANEELHAKTLEALIWAWGLASDSSAENLVKILCYRCGISIDEVENEFRRTT